jgi:hypothetical protein
MTDQPESWRPVLDDHYEVSSLGKVRRLKPCSRSKPGYVLIPHPDRKGYFRARCTVNGRSKLYRIHRLVMLAFVGPCPRGMEVNHKDGDKKNNALENLEYATPEKNQAHATVNGLRASGERVGNAKLTADTVRGIKKDLCAMPTSAVSRKHNLPHSTVDAIKHGKTWRHVAVEGEGLWAEHAQLSPARDAILMALSGQAKAVADIIQETRLTESAVRSCLHKLNRAGLVFCVRRGVWQAYGTIRGTDIREWIARKRQEYGY